MASSKEQGFTLIELLIAAAVAIILVVIINNSFVNTTNATNVVQNQQLMLEDLRASGNFAADTLKNAFYIYPKGVSITMNAAHTYSVTRPAGGTTWLIGTDPMIAALVPGSRPDIQCANVNTGAPLTAGPDGCASFVAFYLVKRSTVVSGAASTPVFPGSDSANDATATMLFFYKTRLAVSLSGIQSTLSTGTLFQPPTTIGSAADDGSVVADYLAGAGFTATALNCTVSGKVYDPTGNSGVAATSNLAPCDPTGYATPSIFTGVSNMTLTLQSRIIRSGRTSTSPALTFAITPLNAQISN